MSKANITNERWIKVTDHDCDGVYQYTEIRGDITYTCCGFVDVSAHTFMGDGDGDKCPKCGAEITFSRKSAQQRVQRTGYAANQLAGLA
jgi:hypothetical protein